MTYEEFKMLPYEQRCKLTICKDCIHQDICDGAMQINCDCYIKGDPEDSVVLTKEEFSKALTDNFNMGKKEAQFYSERVAIPTTRKETTEKFAKLFFEHITTLEVWESLRQQWLAKGGNNDHLWNLLIQPVLEKVGVEIKES